MYSWQDDSILHMQESFGKLYENPTIGDPIRPVEIEDIPRANKLLYATCIVGAILFFGLSVLLKTVL